jgi:VanZ family protein
MLRDLTVKYRQAIQIIFWVFVLSVFYFTLRPDHSVHNGFPIDKIEHFAAYFVLGWLWSAGKGLRSWRGFLLAFALLTLMGGAIELLQSTHWIARQASWLDFIANAGGAFFGLLASYLLRLFAKP